MENISMRNEVELVYAKDIIPSLAFVPKPYVGYPKGYVDDWRKQLMDVWGGGSLRRSALRGKSMA